MASINEIQELLTQIKDMLPSLINRSQITPQQVTIVTGLSDLSERLGLVMAGEFRVGNSKEPGDGFSGVRIGYPAFSYNSENWNIVGVENDVLQIGIRSSDGKLLAAGGDVIIDEAGVTVVNNTAGILFYDTSGNLNMYIYSTLSDSLVFNNLVPGGNGGMSFYVKLTDNSTPYIELIEDAAVRLKLDMTQTYLHFVGGDGASAYVSPADPGENSLESRANLYVRNQKLIVQYNDAGTIRYKYLDLTGTGVTWIHTTSAP